MQTTIEKDELVRNLIGTLRSDFHLNVLPQKNVVPNNEMTAQVNRVTLGATIARAESVAKRLGQNDPDAPFHIMGTSPTIVDALKTLLTDQIGNVELAKSIRSSQDAFSRAIDPTHPVNVAITPYVTTLAPPTKRRQPSGFGG